MNNENDPNKPNEENQTVGIPVANDTASDTPATPAPAEPTAPAPAEPNDPAATPAPAADEPATTEPAPAAEEPAAATDAPADPDGQAQTDAPAADTSTNVETGDAVAGTAPAAASTVEVSFVVDGATKKGTVAKGATVSSAYKSIVGGDAPVNTTFRSNGRSVTGSSKLTASTEITTVAKARHG